MRVGIGDNDGGGPEGSGRSGTGHLRVTDKMKAYAGRTTHGDGDTGYKIASGDGNKGVPGSGAAGRRNGSDGGCICINIIEGRGLCIGIGDFEHSISKSTGGCVAGDLAGAYKTYVGAGSSSHGDGDTGYKIASGDGNGGSSAGRAAQRCDGRDGRRCGINIIEGSGLQTGIGDGDNSSSGAGRRSLAGHFRATDKSNIQAVGTSRNSVHSD